MTKKTGLTGGFFLEQRFWASVQPLSQETTRCPAIGSAELLLWRKGNGTDTLSSAHFIIKTFFFSFVFIHVGFPEEWDCFAVRKHAL